MVGNGVARMTQITPEDLAEAMRDSYPELDAVRAAAADPVYLVGGAVRDLLRGAGRSANLDLVVEGDAAALANRVAEEVLEHERFGTATARLGDLEVDFATARTESYPEPGALPEVRLGAGIEADLGRRDFTVNAIAVPLAEPRLIDPHGGEGDLDARLLRALHPASFVDDPTRALRAARYAARLGFAIERETGSRIREADLGSVSADRRDSELRILCSEARAAAGFELLAEWGLIQAEEGGVELAAAVSTLLATPPWAGFANRGEAVFDAVFAPTEATRELAAADPDSPSQGVALAARHRPEQLALARAMGGAWLDRYLEVWRGVSLEIDGEDLIEAGVPEGPAVGRGLAEALRRKLDGELGAGRDSELAAAIEAAEDGDGLE